MSVDANKQTRALIMDKIIFQGYNKKLYLLIPYPFLAIYCLTMEGSFELVLFLIFSLFTLPLLIFFKKNYVKITDKGLEIRRSGLIANISWDEISSTEVEMISNRIESEVLLRLILHGGKKDVQSKKNVFYLNPANFSTNLKNLRDAIDKQLEQKVQPNSATNEH